MTGHHHLVRPAHTIQGADPVDDLDTLSADVALYGVPWDAGSLSLMLSPGQRFGPNALRTNNVSLTGCVADARIIDLETGREHLEGWKLADLGDLDLMPSLGAEENFKRISEVARLVASRDVLPVRRRRPLDQLSRWTRRISTLRLRRHRALRRPCRLRRRDRRIKTDPRIQPAPALRTTKCQQHHRTRASPCVAGNL